MATAVAVHRVLNKAGAGGCSIKWPNDVLAADGRKLCGILTEEATCAATGGRAFIVGVGINVNQSTTDFPDELRDKASSLRILLGEAVSRCSLLKDVLKELPMEFAVEARKLLGISLEGAVG